MDTLVKWKERASERKPLILNGARQVGKTYLITEFAVQHYQNFVYVNFETNPAIASYFDQDISPKRIIPLLEASSRVRILPRQTLIVFDEVQICERALTSLKYFCEEAHEYPVMAAGSLLGVALNREKYSFPVGKVEIETLHPLDFEEFLWSLGEEALLDEIRNAFAVNTPLPEALHVKALELYQKYLIVGGMPASIREYLKEGKLLLVPDIQNDILNAYISDMAKYATPTESVKIRGAYDSIPTQLAKENKKFQYKLVRKGGTTSIFGIALDWLQASGIVLKCTKVEQGFLPLSAHQDLSSFKLYMSDVGLLTAKSGIPQQAVLSSFGGAAFMGAITENYVAQALQKNGYLLHYWESKSIAEIDFVIQKEGFVIPIEVKAGTHTRSRSLSVYLSKYPSEYSIRVSAKNFGFENHIKSVPLYGVFLL